MYRVQYAGATVGRHISSGMILGTVLLVAAAVLTVAYLGFGVFRDDHGFDTWLLLVWVAVIVAFVVILFRRTRTREMLTRRFFLSEDGIYNFELGYAPLPEAIGDNLAFQVVSFAVDSLAAMSYGFEVVEQPQDFEPEMVITTTVLDFHWPEDADENDGAVIDRWEGSLLRIVKPGDWSACETIGTYRNARELALLLEDSGMLL